MFEDLRHVGADAQLACPIHASGPFEIDRAGNVSALGCQDFLAGVLQRPARIPDCQVGGAETALQVFAGGGGFVVQGQLNRAAHGWRDLDRHGQAFCQPGRQAAVDIVVLAVADDIQQPDEASGPTAAFVVIHHVDRIGVVPQLTKQRFECCLRGHQPRGGGLAELRTLWIDKARAGNVPFGVAGGTGQVHQNQFAGVEAREQVARLDHQRQAREVRHVRSPEHKREDCNAAYWPRWLKLCRAFSMHCAVLPKACTEISENGPPP
ncbi:hypothetical protein D9M71_253110 [compost metagenome]